MADALIQLVVTEAIRAAVWAMVLLVAFRRATTTK
jgi:hypothetical protein